MSSSGSRIAPMCLGLVLADAIWHDPSSGKRTILGTFSTIFAKQFPAQHGILAVYCILTDGYGKTRVRLRVVDIEEDDGPLIEAEGEVDFIDPRMIAEMDFHFTGLVFPHAGEYRVQVFGADEFLMERRLLVLDPSQAGEAENA